MKVSLIKAPWINTPMGKTPRVARGGEQINVGHGGGRGSRCCSSRGAHKKPPRGNVGEREPGRRIKVSVVLVRSDVGRECDCTTFILAVCLFFWVPRLPLSGTAAKPSEDKPVAKRARKKDSAIDSFAKLAAAYGHPSLRGFQQTAISGVVEGKHVVMVVGVGGGKTLPLEASIFHARNMGRGSSASQALVFVGSTDDVMATFAREMNERFPAVEGGVPVALHVTADTSQRELRAALNGTYAVVYAGPQHLTRQGKLAELLSDPGRKKLFAVAIDEFHLYDIWCGEWSCLTRWLFKTHLSPGWVEIGASGSMIKLLAIWCLLGCP